MSAISTSSPAIGTQLASEALENYQLLAEEAATLISTLVTNTGSADVWLLVIDKATAPADNDEPLQAFRIPAEGTAALDTPIACAAGIVLALSSTPQEYTALVGDVGWFLSRYV
jgi:hypothetical protein